MYHIPILVDNSTGGQFSNISPKLIVISNLLLGQTTILKEEIRRMISIVVPAPVEGNDGMHSGTRVPSS